MIDQFASVYVIDWLKKQMPLNIMKEQSLTYTKTTFVLTLTYVLMDIFLSLFWYDIKIDNYFMQVNHTFTKGI